MNRERTGFYGHVKIHLDGKLVVDLPNLITDVGLAQLAGLINGTVSDFGRYIALGTGTSPADAGDVALETEVTFGGGERKLADTIDRVTTTAADDTMRLIAEYAITTGFTLSEVGLFTALSGPLLVSRDVFSGISVSASQTLVVTWTIRAVRA